MANTYNWQIHALDTRPSQDDLSNVVYNIHWTLIATSDQLDDDGNAYTAESIGTQSIETGDVTNFTAFEDLTQEIVEGWVEDSELDVDGIKASLDAQIEKAINPVSVTKNVPW